VSLPFFADAEMGFGVTVFGRSKVLMLSTFADVSVSPEADLAFEPRVFRSISAARFASRFVIAPHRFPSLPFAAIASIRGRAIPLCVYVPALNVTGTDVESWNGIYILKT